MRISTVASKDTILGSNQTPFITDACSRHDVSYWLVKPCESSSWWLSPLPCCCFETGLETEKSLANEDSLSYPVPSLYVEVRTFSCKFLYNKMPRPPAGIIKNTGLSPLLAVLSRVSSSTSGFCHNENTLNHCDLDQVTGFHLAVVPGYCTLASHSL